MEQNCMAMLAEPLAKQESFLASRTRLEAGISDHYQMMVSYQRQRHFRENSENWPEGPVDAPAVTNYPNILAELDASGWWLDRIAGFAGVSQEIMAAVMEGGEKLSWQELNGLQRCFGCRINYLTAPVLSMVDPTTNKGKWQLRRLKDLVQQTVGMDLFLYHTYSQDVLPKMEAGKPVTYAAYRWACNRLQNLLDSRAREERQQQRTRTVTLSATKETGPDTSSLHNRLRIARRCYKVRMEQARKQEHCNAAQKRLCEIREYIDKVNAPDCEISSLQTDLFALAEMSGTDRCGALLLAVMYGQAMGYRSAKE